MVWGEYLRHYTSDVFTICRKQLWTSQCVRACFHIGGRRGWRPRSSWKLLSSHPACRAIQALKEPSELLKRAEEGWEFLSQWKLLEDINFYYHFVFSTVDSHELVCARFAWVVRAFVPRRWKYKGMVLFLFADLLGVFFGRYVWKWGWSLKRGDGIDVSCVFECVCVCVRVWVYVCVCKCVCVCVWSAGLCLRPALHLFCGGNGPGWVFTEFVTRVLTSAWVLA